MGLDWFTQRSSTRYIQCVLYLRDSHRRTEVKQRFGKHAPMHRLAVVVLTAPQDKLELKSLEPPDIVKHCESVGQLGSSCCRRKKQHEAGSKRFTAESVDALKTGRYAKMHAAEVLSRQRCQFEVKVSQIHSASAPKKQCEWPKQFPVIRCFTPGCLEVQAPVEKAKVVPLDLCSEDGFIEGMIMASSWYAEIVYCSLLTKIQSGCFETVVCFYWNVEKNHHLTQVFNQVQTNHHLEWNSKCKSPSLYDYEIAGQDMFGACWGRWPPMRCSAYLAA